MSVVLVPTTGLFELLHNHGPAGLPGLARPPLTLLECLVAGTSFRHRLAEYEPCLNPGLPLRLHREPANAHDEWAVTVSALLPPLPPAGAAPNTAPTSSTTGTAALPAAEVLLGYLPRQKNEVIARLLDAGKNLTGSLLEKEWEGGWLRLQVRVLLHE